MRYHRAVLYLNQNPDAPNPHVADVYAFADGTGGDDPLFSVRFEELSFAGIDVGPLSTIDDEQIIEISGTGLTNAEIETVHKSSTDEPDDIYRLSINADTGTDMPVVPIERT